EDRAVGVRGDLQLAHDLARMIGGNEALAAILDPLHRTPEPHGGQRDQQILRIELAAHAEAAADVDLDQLDAGLVQTEHASERAAIEEGHLRRAEHGELARRPRRNEAPRFQRYAAVAVAS